MKNRVRGMWRPETITATVGGKTLEPFGPKPTGLLCFHESLHFVELMSDPSVPHFASDAREAGTAEEDKAAVIGNLALFGTYTVDGEGNFTGNLVQGCTFPNWIGDQRTAEQLKEVVDGDHMRESFQSGGVRVEIHWQRVLAPYKRSHKHASTGEALDETRPKAGLKPLAGTTKLLMRPLLVSRWAKSCDVALSLVEEKTESWKCRKRCKACKTMKLFPTLISFFLRRNNGCVSAERPTHPEASAG